MKVDQKGGAKAIKSTPKCSEIVTTVSKRVPKAIKNNPKSSQKRPRGYQKGPKGEQCQNGLLPASFRLPQRIHIRSHFRWKTRFKNHREIHAVPALKIKHKGSLNGAMMCPETCKKYIIKRILEKERKITKMSVFLKGQNTLKYCKGHQFQGFCHTHIRTGRILKPYENEVKNRHQIDGKSIQKR